MHSFLVRNAAALLWSAWRRRYLIAIPIVIMPLLALGFGVLSPKKYMSYTTVLIQEAAKLNPFLEDLAVATNLKSRMEALNALLHSRHILAGVAVEQKMISDEMPIEERESVIASLSKSLTAELVGEDIIKISLKTETSEGMRELLWTISMRFIEQVISPGRSAIAKSEIFLIEELEKRRKDLLVTEQKLSDYKTRYASELPNLHASNVDRLSKVRANLADRRISLEGAQAARDSLRQRLVQTDPVIGRIEEAIVQSLSDIAVLRARYTDRHSTVQAMLRKLKSLKNERDKALHAVRQLSADDLERLWNRASMQTTPNDATTQPLLVSQLQNLQDSESLVNGLQEEVSSLKSELNDLESSVSAFGEHERNLKEFDREIAVQRKTFDELYERHQKAKLTGALSRSEERERVKVIDPPFTPVGPSNPSLLVFIGAGVLGGILLGCGLAVMAELLDMTIWRRDVLGTLTGAPVLTRIPVLPNDGFAEDRDALDLSMTNINDTGVSAHA
ncbi:MAG: capsule biosynthesis protein [Rhodospirillaceae bacterium]|nr:MAG: capsule biosynthesis protein [Rhodospirillaceae bacterium]